jgi:hypothetical protein
MSQEELEAIAQRNVKPIIGEMDRQVEEDRKNAELQKAKDEEDRLDAEREKEARKFQKEQEKRTQKEVKNAKSISSLS